MANSQSIKPHPLAWSDRTKARFWARVNKTPDGCWLWRGHLAYGYGAVAISRGQGTPGCWSYRAHRAAFELSGREIPQGLELDHLCRVRHCVNPDHLEAVTGAENWRRGLAITVAHAAKTECINGHQFTPENTRIIRKKKNGRPLAPARTCRTCERVAQRKRYSARTAALRASGLCVRCGRVRHPESASKCQRCLDRSSVYNRRWRAAITPPDAQEAGKPCASCHRLFDEETLTLNCGERWCAECIDLWRRNGRSIDG